MSENLQCPENIVLNTSLMTTIVTDADTKYNGERAAIRNGDKEAIARFDRQHTDVSFLDEVAANCIAHNVDPDFNALRRSTYIGAYHHETEEDSEEFLNEVTGRFNKAFTDKLS
jgi:hypothetical protein